MTSILLSFIMVAVIASISGFLRGLKASIGLSVFMAFVGGLVTYIYVESTYIALPINTALPPTSAIKKSAAIPEGVCVQASFTSWRDCMFWMNDQPFTSELITAMPAVKSVQKIEQEGLADDVTRFAIDAPGFPIKEIVLMGEASEVQSISWTCMELRGKYHLQWPAPGAPCRKFFGQLLAGFADHPENLMTPLFNLAADNELRALIVQDGYSFSYQQGVYTITRFNRFNKSLPLAGQFVAKVQNATPQQQRWLQRFVESCPGVDKYAPDIEWAKVASADEDGFFRVEYKIADLPTVLPAPLNKRSAGHQCYLNMDVGRLEAAMGKRACHSMCVGQWRENQPNHLGWQFALSPL